MTEDNTITKTTSTAKTTTRKKTTSTKKKSSTTASNTMRLSAAERTLIHNYRKCNALEKKLVAGLAEKISGNIDYNALLNSVLDTLKK